MSTVLFLGMPSHGHVNPTLGLVSELVKQGEKVIYFASEPFKEKIEAAGAIFKAYNRNLDIFTPGAGQISGKPGGLFTAMYKVISDAPVVIADILNQTRDIKFDYLIHSAAFIFTQPMVQILGIPAVSSLAVYAGLRDFSGRDFSKFPGAGELLENYGHIAASLEQSYSINMPARLMELLMNKAALNLVYTSEYFVPDREFFDDTYKFVGPPVFERKENLDFPFEKLHGKKVMYISLGTVFGNFDEHLYHLFFEAFKNWPGIVVMAAHRVDLSPALFPENFIVMDYVPQSTLLKHTDIAITHAGMNSISDLISAEVPFVCVPLGADQPLLAKRAAELGATLSLDVADLSAQKLIGATEKVLNDPSYKTNIQKIADSFRQAGGYPKAAEEIFLFKEKNQIG
jgi:MGT family glycosyltransferase